PPGSASVTGRRARRCGGPRSPIRPVPRRTSRKRRSSTLSTASATPAAALRGVSKRLGARVVVDAVSLAVPHGVICGLIGPSGSGKTTLIRLLLGMYAPTAGEITVLGVSPRRFTPRHRAQIGYTPQGFVLYPTLTVQENARFVAGLYGL